MRSKPAGEYKLAGETEDAYHVQAPDGVVHEVPKRGASKALLAAMQYLPRLEPQALADGGDVAGGVPATFPTALGIPLETTVPASPAFPTHPVPGEDPLSALTNQDLAQLRGQANPDQQALIDRELQAREGVLRPGGAVGAPSAEDVAAVASPPRQTQAQAPAQGSPYGPYASGYRVPDDSQLGAIAPAPPAGGTVGSEPAFPAFPSLNTAPFEKRIQAMEQTNREGIELQRQAQERQAAEATKIYEAQQADLAGLHQRWQGEREAAVREYHNAIDDYSKQRIDPAQFWSTRSTGQKVSAVVGMVLGGIGSGLTGQPNQALAIIDRAIDRDIDAQRAEMGKKQNLVSILHSRIGDVDEATAMAKMYLYADVATKLNLAGARSGNLQAQATAKLLSAQATERALTPVLQLVDMKHQNLMQQYNVAWQRYQFNWMRGQVAGDGGGGGGGGYLPSRASPPMGKDMMDVPGLMKDRSERSVVGPGGRQFIAYTADAAKAAREKLAAQDELEGMIDRLDELRQKVHGKIIPLSNAANLYDKYRAMLAFSYMNAHGLKRLSKEDIVKVDAGAPDKLDVFLRGESSFEPLRRAVHENRVSTWKYAGLDPRFIPPFEAPVPGAGR